MRSTICGREPGSIASASSGAGWAASSRPPLPPHRTERHLILWEPVLKPDSYVEKAIRSRVISSLSGARSRAALLRICS